MDDRPAGVSGRGTLRELGATRSALAHRVQHKRWLRPHREVYVLPHLVTDPVRTSARAALAAVPSAAAASHLLAGHLHHLAGLPTLLRPEVTVSADHCRRTVRGVVIHRSRMLETEELHGLLVTPVPRTIADLAGGLPPGRLLAVMDSALRSHAISPSQLLALCAHAPATQATLAVRRLAPWASGRSESALESMVRLILLDAGLGPLALQITVTCDGATYRIDLGFPDLRLGIEADGRAVHSAPDALLHDRWRQNALLAAGWLLLRFSWDDVLRRPEYVVAAVRRAIQARSAA